MRYEEVIIGAEIGCHEFQITPQMQQNYLEALEDSAPLYIEGNSTEAPIAHPVLVVNYAFAAEWIGSFAQHVHAKNYVRFLAPTRVGKRIIARSRVYDKYIRRGRTYVTTQFTCIDEDGLEVVHCRWTETHGKVEQ